MVCFQCSLCGGGEGSQSQLSERAAAGDLQEGRYYDIDERRLNGEDSYNYA